jgi:hypothetical protein
MARIDGWLGKDDPLGGKGQLAPRRQQQSAKWLKMSPRLRKLPANHGK